MRLPVGDPDYSRHTACKIAREPSLPFPPEITTFENARASFHFPFCRPSTLLSSKGALISPTETIAASAASEFDSLV